MTSARCSPAVPYLLIGIGIPFQSVLAYRLGLFGGQPDLSLTVVLVWAAFCGPATGSTLGFWSGVFHGTIVGESIGTWTVVRTIAGFAAGAAVNHWLQPGPATAVAATFAGTLFEGLVLLLVNPGLATASQVKGIFASTLWNTVLAIGLATWLSSGSRRMHSR